MPDLQSNAGYADEAPELLIRYEAMRFTDVHAHVLAFLPSSPSTILDIGAGTGRDAAHFASQGHQVVAVEPTAEMRQGAIALHHSLDIDWLDDRLPELNHLLARSQTFDVVMLNAVWMHFDKPQREASMRSINQLLHVGSRVFIKLRHGDVPQGRIMYEVSGEETLQLAARFGMEKIHHVSRRPFNSAVGDAGVTWTDLVLEKKQASSS